MLLGPGVKATSTGAVGTVQCTMRAAVSVPMMASSVPSGAVYPQQLAYALYESSCDRKVMFDDVCANAGRTKPANATAMSAVLEQRRRARCCMGPSGK